MAARFRVVVLDRPDPNNSTLFRYLMWVDVPAARQSFYAKPVGTVSAWTGAISGDNSQIVSGAVVEKVDTVQGHATWAVSDYEVELQTRWQAFHDQVVGSGGNVWNAYGTTWDGTTWTVTGVA